MAQEQIRGRAVSASDQYSLAVMAYELLCGKPPFEGNFVELADQHVNELPQPIYEIAPEIHFQINDVLQKALSKKPEERFESVRQFAQALELARQSSELFRNPVPPPVPRVTTPPPTRPRTGLTPVQRQQTQNNPAQSPGQTPAIKPRWRRSPASAKHKILASALIVVALLLLIGMSCWGVALMLQGTKGPIKLQLPAVAQLFTKQAPDSELVGMSIGATVFDTTLSDRALKSQAASQFSAGHYGQAEDLLSQALVQDTNDAEALIYRENARVMEQGYYISIFAGTILTGNSTLTGRDNLQGVYVAQKEHNDSCKSTGCIPVRLIVANAGTGDSATNGITYADMLMQQMVIEAHADATIVGIVGWPASSLSSNVGTILYDAHLPIVSPSATITPIEQSQPYAFSVAPSVSVQGAYDARFALNDLHARRIAIFVDPVDPYSAELANAFSQSMSNFHATIVAQENYTIGKPATLQTTLKNVLLQQPDLIYFAGNSQDASALLTNMGSCLPSRSCPVMLGPDTLYGDYTAAAQANLPLLYFTSFAYQDAWGIMDGSNTPGFFEEYMQAFDPQHLHIGSPYGYTRPDSNSILAYDAMKVLLDVGNRVVQGGQSITRTTLQAELDAITGSQVDSGASGVISFDSSGNAIDKIILVLHYDQERHIQFITSYGCLTQYICH